GPAAGRRADPRRRPRHLAERAGAAQGEETRRRREGVARPGRDPDQTRRRAQAQRRRVTPDTTKADDIALVIEEAIVSFVPNRGVRVRTISREELHEAFMGRAELEALATEVAATKITPADLAELEAAEQHFAQVSKDLRAREPGDARRSIMGEWVRANHAFHDVIYRVADLPFVAQLVLRAGGLGAGRPLDRRPLREERRAAPGDPAVARSRQPVGRARARARARHVLLRHARDDPRAGRWLVAPGEAPGS